MPAVNASLNLWPLEQEQVWSTLCEFERYPEFIEDVLSVIVEQRNDNEIISSWLVLLNGSKLGWTERDLILPNHRIEFQQIDGDLEAWSGAWSIQRAGKGLSVQLDVQFDLGIPFQTDSFHSIGEQAIRAHSSKMLEGILDRTRRLKLPAVSIEE